MGENKASQNDDSAESEENSSNQYSELLLQLRKILGSCNLNFLFGAGVNGGAFPSFGGFNKTLKKIEELGLCKDVGIENALRGRSDEEKRKDILEVFVDEYNGYKNYELNHVSLVNLGDLLHNASRIVDKAENRHPESKRVNIFTLNYDRIVEDLLDKGEELSYALTQDKSKGKLPFNVVGYDTVKHAFIPTFCVYKLHGSVTSDRILHADNIVFPSQDKLGNILSHFYETLFAMKGELLRKNSVLFVIGYSGADDHVNGIVEDAIANGLTVYWLQYKVTDEIPGEMKKKVIVVPPASSKDKTLQDTTKTLADLFEKAMHA